jgi:S-adenosylmethionine decarboxylase
MKKFMNNHKIQIHGFNNLSKLLSLSLYLFSYGKTLTCQEKCLTYINDRYNSKYLSELLSNLASMIDANILNIALQDYQPHGASAALLVAEEIIEYNNYDVTIGKPIVGKAVVGHLDKSHITVHTYPEQNYCNGICTFRADVDISTCGKISPLRVLNYLMQVFNPHLAIIDYQVRGFTRDIAGIKYYIDHSINSIQEYINLNIKKYYRMFDVNLKEENMFRTKMVKNKLLQSNYFGLSENMVATEEMHSIEVILQQEILDIVNKVAK